MRLEGLGKLNSSREYTKIRNWHENTHTYKTPPILKYIVRYTLFNQHYGTNFLYNMSEFLN
jgi:hypothetical protein